MPTSRPSDPDLFGLDSYSPSITAFDNLTPFQRRVADTLDCLWEERRRLLRDADQVICSGAIRGAGRV